MMGGELFENLLYPLTDWRSLPHKMTGMLKAELNTNLLLLNNQQLSALYFISRGRRHPPDSRLELQMKVHPKVRNHGEGPY